MTSLRDRIKEVMLQWGGSMSDLLNEEGLDEWINDLTKEVEAWLDEETSTTRKV